MRHALRCALALGVVAIVGLCSPGVARTAAQDTLPGTSSPTAVITQVTRTAKMAERRLPAGFAHQLLLTAPAGTHHIVLRGFVSEQAADVAALRIYQGMLQQGTHAPIPAKPPHPIGWTPC